MDSNSLNFYQIVSISIFGLVFGFFETVTNFIYLLTNNNKWPRLQHGKELPREADEIVIVRKVKQMFVLGMILLLITFLSVLISAQLFIIGSALIFLNGLLDYIKYQNRHFLTIWTGISLVSSILIFLPL